MNLEEAKALKIRTIEGTSEFKAVMEKIKGAIVSGSRVAEFSHSGDYTGLTTAMINRLEELGYSVNRESSLSCYIVSGW